MWIHRLAAVVFTLAVAGSAGCSARHQTPLSAPDQARQPARPRSVRDLQAQLTTIFNAPVMAHASWGVEVRSLDRGEVLFSHNAGRLMMPASNMKILTLAAAAERLGWEHRFTTTLESSADVENGILRGDLYVRGTGDPTMSTRGRRGAAVLDEWSAALRAAGVHTIEGRVIGDDNAFDDEALGPGWSWDYLEAGYAAPIGALQYNENTADLTTAPGARVGDAVIVSLAPGTGLTLVNLARTAEAAETPGRGGVSVQRRLDRPELVVTGSLPVSAPSATRVVAVVNPTLFFAQSVKDGLVSRGISVTGPALDADDIVPDLPGGRERRVLARTDSPPLREVGTVLMKVSQNQYAETLLKALGASQGGLGTIAAGRRAAAEIFRAWGVRDDGYVMSDGSGLSRYNYTSASTITTILSRMHAEARHREPFLATLPVAGKDGTISTRMRRTPAEGNAMAKTGSIANVRSLSGYVKTRDGETLVFAMLANDFVVPAATVNWIADLAVEVLANFRR